MEPIAFVHSDARAEINRSCMERRSEVPCFFYTAMRV
jgi:hypothetical protein